MGVASVWTRDRSWPCLSRRARRECVRFPAAKRRLVCRSRDRKRHCVVYRDSDSDSRICFHCAKAATVVATSGGWPENSGTLADFGRRQAPAESDLPRAYFATGRAKLSLKNFTAAGATRSLILRRSAPDGDEAAGAHRRTRTERERRMTLLRGQPKGPVSRRTRGGWPRPCWGRREMRRRRSDRNVCLAGS